MKGGEEGGSKEESEEVNEHSGGKKRVRRWTITVGRKRGRGSECMTCVCACVCVCVCDWNGAMKIW